jgi:tetratricopeptide (TPR) repeat protein
MGFNSLNVCYLPSRLLLLIVYISGSCHAQTRWQQHDTVPSRAAAVAGQSEAESAELQTTLGGNLKDFTVTVGGSGNQANRPGQQSQDRDAAAAYREALKTDPNSAELHFDLSVVQARLGDARSAQEELEIAIRLKRDFAKALNQLGILHMLIDEKAEAEDEFKAAISADPQLLEAMNNLAVLYAWTGKDLEASELFRRVIQGRPSYAPAHTNLGLLLAGEGRYADAEKEFRNALRGSPSHLSAYSALGMVAAKLGRGEEAIKILRKVAQVQRDSAPAHANLGMALADDGFDLPGALEQFSETIRLDPKSAVAHYNKGRVLYDLHRGDEASVELDTACRLQPDYREALYLLAQLEKQLGNIQRSADILDDLVTREPSNQQAQVLLGRNLLTLGKTDEAIRHLQIAVGFNPNDEDALYNLAQALGRTGNPDAKIYLERFQSLKKQRETEDRVQKLGSYGLEAAKARDWTQAVADFEEAIELCVPCASLEDLHRNLGLIYVLKGDVEGGRRELETALKLKPDDADARRALESLPSRGSASH